jgi:hypothetical protein
MTETRFFGFICHLPMPQQRCAEGLKTWCLWVLLRLFQYLPNSSFLFGVFLWLALHHSVEQLAQRRKERKRSFKNLCELGVRFLIPDNVYSCFPQSFAV